MTQLNLSRCGGLAGYHGRNIFGIVDHALCFLWLFIAATAFVVVQTITRFAGCQQYIHTFFITPIHRHISNADLQPGNSATWCGVLIKKSPNAIALKIPGRNSTTSELSLQEPTFSGGNASSYHPAHAPILGKVGGDASSAVRVGEVPSRFLPAIRESARRPPRFVEIFLLTADVVVYTTHVMTCKLMCRWEIPEPFGSALFLSQMQPVGDRHPQRRTMGTL